jgi:hypothetical protein
VYIRTGLERALETLLQGPALVVRLCEHSGCRHEWNDREQTLPELPFAVSSLLFLNFCQDALLSDKP